MNAQVDSVTDMKNVTVDLFDSRNGEGAVTDADNPHANNSDIRNAGDESLNQIAAQINALDPRSEIEKRRARLKRASFETAEICYRCERTIRPNETVCRVFTTTRGFFGHGTGVAVICSDCGDKDHWRNFFRARPCQSCGRPVRIQATTRTFVIIACSGRCREAIQKIQAEESREKSREIRNFRCETCNQLFTPKRTDAKHCSPACKQKAYRQRKA